MLEPSDRTLIAAAGRRDAAAFAGCRRHRRDAPPPSWPFAMARRLLAESRRRGAVEYRTRRRLGLARLELDEGDLERIAQIRAHLPGRLPSPDLLERLPEARREALRARTLDELEHPHSACALPRSPIVATPHRGRGRRRIGEAEL